MKLQPRFLSFFLENLLDLLDVSPKQFEFQLMIFSQNKYYGKFASIMSLILLFILHVILK